ncbi:MAG: FAD-dependent oxidoreductase [Oligosphaeraceae bacterium]
MLLYTKEIEIKHRFDVAVMGCGPAGVAAAIAAARNHHSVLVIDSLSMAGGMSTAALVPLLMDYSDGVNFLAGGIGREIFDRAQASGAMRGPAIYAEALKRLYEEMMEEAGVVISYNTTLIDAITENGRIRHCVCAAKSGIFAVEARLFIDATGDGDLSYLAGAPWECGDEEGRMMPGTLCSLWAGVDWEAFLQGGAFSHNDENMLAILRRAYEEGIVPVDDYHHPGMIRTNDQLAAGNLSHCFDVNPLDELSMTRALVEGRKLLACYEKMYNKYVQGFQKACLATSGSIMGIRESRRIQGDYVLNREDYEKRAVFEDEIGRYNFSIDVHPSLPGSQALAEHKKLFWGKRYGKGESYGIPYRILCPRKVENLLTAGRCVSTDRALMASLRVIPGCWITGMAAGTAAALCLDTGATPRTLEVRRLQKTLKEQGAFLPNFRE